MELPALPPQGLSANHFEDEEIKKATIDSAGTSIVLTGSHKATYLSLTQYTSWRDINYLITNSDISPKTVQQVKEMTMVIQV